MHQHFTPRSRCNKPDPEPEPTPVQPSSYTFKINSQQAQALRTALEKRALEFFAAPHTAFAARSKGLTVLAYLSGKLVLQGKNAREFVEFTLEPEVLGEARLGYEEVHQPQQFEPHIGIDESGKGDFFGPLVIAAAYVEKTTARKLLDLGVRDSKQIGSDQRIEDLAEKIRDTIGSGRFSVVSIGPAKYNQLYHSFGNLNRLLAWGHATALENVLTTVPACPRAVADQFGNQRLIINALKEKGQAITLEQRTKAESDIAVAAASILARAKFVESLRTLGKKMGCTLPKGASSLVQTVAREILQKHGHEALASICKEHFKTFSQVIEKR